MTCLALGITEIIIECFLIEFLCEYNVMLDNSHNYYDAGFELFFYENRSKGA